MLKTMLYQDSYNKLRGILLRLCRRERLQLIEVKLKNNGIIIFFSKGDIIINSTYKEKEIPQRLLEIFSYTDSQKVVSA